MGQIKEEGCGYVAIVNSIYTEYEGRETEFEETFGFPMYNKKGIANYDYLILDFYENTDDRFYLNEPWGATALVCEVVRFFKYTENDETKYRTEAFRILFGCDLFINENGEDTLNPEARQRVLDKYQIDQDVVTLETSGNTIYEIENRTLHYLTEKNVPCTSDMLLTAQPLSNEEINQYMDDGKNVNILLSEFNLYKENGDVAAKDVGGHWMTITGTTEDGQYIVSSWENGII